jgi:hypothetical protein
MLKIGVIWPTQNKSHTKQTHAEEKFCWQQTRRTHAREENDEFAAGIIRRPGLVIVLGGADEGFIPAATDGSSCVWEGKLLCGSDCGGSVRTTSSGASGDIIRSGTTNGTRGRAPNTRRQRIKKEQSVSRYRYQPF